MSPIKRRVSQRSTKSNGTGELALATPSAAESLTTRAKPSGRTTKTKRNGSAADDRLQEVLNRLKDPTQRKRATDVETSGLDWRQNHIVGYVVTFSPAPADSYYIPFRHLGDANVGGKRGPDTATGWDGKLAPGEKELIRTLDEPDTLMFGHNMAFDLRFMFRTGFTFKPRIEDTYINAPLIDEWAGKFSLEACAARSGVQEKKKTSIIDHLCSKFPEAAKDPKSAMGHYWRLAGDDPVAVEYAAGDGTTTWQLRDAQMLDIQRPDRFKGQDVPSLARVWDIESRLIPVLARMMTRGIKINEEALEQTKKLLNKRIEQLLNEFPSGFNPRSPLDVRAWMERHGHTDWPMTAGRFVKAENRRVPQPSFTKDWLELHPAGKKIIDVRKLETMLSSFINPLSERHVWRGRVHTSYHQLRGDEYGVVTGRLSSSDPNLHAVHKNDEELGRMYRGVFEPDYDVWGEDDYNQCEPRLLGYYSRSKALFAGYTANPPVDAHKAVAISMTPGWHKMTPEQQKERRQTGKRLNQTLITGGGVGVLESKYKVPRAEGQKAFDEFFRANPEIKAIQRRATQMMGERGYIVSLLHRRSRMPPDGRDYVGLNRLLQCGNADILKYKMVVIDEYLESEAKGQPINLLNNCHDALSSQFDESARPVYNKCLEMMADFGPNSLIQLDIPMAVDAGEGRNWAIATYGEEKAK